jgi:hypothetical protein
MKLIHKQHIHCFIPLNQIVVSTSHELSIPTLPIGRPLYMQIPYTLFPPRASHTPFPLPAHSMHLRKTRHLLHVSLPALSVTSFERYPRHGPWIFAISVVPHGFINCNSSNITRIYRSYTHTCCRLFASNSINFDKCT